MEKDLEAGVFKIQLGDISKTAISLVGHKSEYTDKQLFEAVTVMAEVFMSKMWDFQVKQGLSQKKKEALATEAGDAMRELLVKYTGVDMHDEAASTGWLS